MRRFRDLIGIAAAVAAFSVPGWPAARLSADEPQNAWVDSTPYYEADAWYDISEWFDNNDFNPTDESWFRIDDEVYDAELDDGSDEDSDYYSYNSRIYDHDVDALDTDDEPLIDPYYFDYDLKAEDFASYDYLPPSEYLPGGALEQPDGETAVAPADRRSSRRSVRQERRPNERAQPTRSGEKREGASTTQPADHTAGKAGTTRDYGFDGVDADDNWFYDFYDEGYAFYGDWDQDADYEFAQRFYDADQDGLYDAYLMYADQNDDGRFDAYRYFAFNQAGRAQEGREFSELPEQQLVRIAQRVGFRGTVRRLKKVSVADTKNWVAQLVDENDETLLVDLGPVNRLRDWEIDRGDPLKAVGPVARVGDARILLAERIESRGRRNTVRRDRSQITGKVTEVRRVDAPTRNYLMAILKSQAGKPHLVDLGPAEGVAMSIEPGDHLTVGGPFVRVQDRKTLFAHSITADSEKHVVNRWKKAAETDADGNDDSS